MRDIKEFNDGLLQFLSDSPTPFHAVKTMAGQLIQAGFIQLSESENWELCAGGKYFVTRNGSSLIAFTLAVSSPLESGWRMVGAHTDSPCLKVKPHPELVKQQYFQLGVEVYGGALLNPWFDRDLSLAGRVSFQRTDGQLASALIDFSRPLAVIPSLAIHLDREANNSHSINAQRDLPPILMMAPDKAVDFRNLLLKQLKSENPSVDAAKVLDFELCFYDCQTPAMVGYQQDFIASARLDNLLSCYTGLKALLDSGQQNCLLVVNDHEEVGSVSAVGAQGPMLASVLERIAGNRLECDRAISRSMMISADNAHGVHPNFADKHDANHGPLLNRGPVVKVNNNQRYATNGQTSALFRHVCELADVPVQTFVVRSDMACGSTIGPLTAGELGVRTLDVGVPTFAMHSIRELAGRDDAHHLYRALCAFNDLAELGFSESF